MSFVFISCVLTNEATIGGTMRLVKYSVCSMMARMTLRPPNAPMKPYTHTIQDGDGGSDFPPRKPSHRLNHGGRCVRPLWMRRSAGTSGSYGGIVNGSKARDTQASAMPNVIGYRDGMKSPQLGKKGRSRDLEVGRRRQMELSGVDVR
jgi:hypothetical protein